VVEVEYAAKHADKPVHIECGLLFWSYRGVEVVEGILAKVDSVEADDAFINDASQNLHILD
jgi:hypothetical protein